MIETSSDYNDELTSTSETIAARLDFSPHADLGETPYMVAVWALLSRIISGLLRSAVPISRSQRSGEWMTPDAISIYGKNFHEQLPKAIGQLQADRSSRRAVVVQSNSECLTSIQWLIRDEELLTISNFRSLDVDHLPADFYWIKKITERVAKMVGAKIGRFTFNVGSLHKYPNSK